MFQFWEQLPFLVQNGTASLVIGILLLAIAHQCYHISEERFSVSKRESWLAIGVFCFSYLSGALLSLSGAACYLLIFHYARQDALLRGLF